MTLKWFKVKYNGTQQNRVWNNIFVSFPLLIQTASKMWRHNQYKQFSITLVFSKQFSNLNFVILTWISNYSWLFSELAVQKGGEILLETIFPSLIMRDRICCRGGQKISDTLLTPELWKLLSITAPSSVVTAQILWTPTLQPIIQYVITARGCTAITIKQLHPA